MIRAYAIGSIVALVGLTGCGFLSVDTSCTARHTCPLDDAGDDAALGSADADAIDGGTDAGLVDGACDGEFCRPVPAIDAMGSDASDALASAEASFDYQDAATCTTPGSSLCDGACVNEMTNDQPNATNCGGCGAGFTCTGGQICVNSSCACSGGYVECSNSCPVAGVSCVKATGIATGEKHACALLSTGTVECWGDDVDGELGNGLSSTSTFAFPVTASNVSGGTAIAASGSHTCALINGTWKCWGDNIYSELGIIGTTMCNGGQDACALTPMALISGATAFSTGTSDSCMVASGLVQCLGQSNFGTVGSTPAPDSCNGGANNCTPSPVNIDTLLTGVTTVSVRGTSACAIVGGSVDCWGGDDFGQGGPNAMGTTCAIPCSRTPVTVPGVSNAVAITTGSFFTCALIQGGTVECWGDNQLGELGSPEMAVCGQSSTPCSTVPIQVGWLTGVTQIAAGDDFVCALLVDGSVECWGNNASHQLGNPNVAATISSSPVQVTGLSGATAIAAGGAFACALVRTGGVMCWGNNSAGQLGNGNTTPSLTAVSVQF